MFLFRESEPSGHVPVPRLLSAHRLPDPDLPCQPARAAAAYCLPGRAAASLPAYQPETAAVSLPLLYVTVHESQKGKYVHLGAKYMKEY